MARRCRRWPTTCAATAGEAQVFAGEPADAQDPRALFDRGAEFGALLAEIGNCRAALDDDTALAGDEAGAQAAQSLRAAGRDRLLSPAKRSARPPPRCRALEADAARAAAPDEPHAAAQPIERLDVADYQGRVWATRRRPWVDRLASAWLIRRFIDRKRAFVWLKSPADCPEARHRLRLRRRHVQPRRRNGHFRSRCWPASALTHTGTAAARRAGALSRCGRRAAAGGGRRRTRAGAACARPSTTTINCC